MSNLSLISQVKVQNQFQQKIAEYEKKTKNIAIAYGGDGTILDVVRQTKGDKAIIPIRNYGICKKHANYLMSILDGTLSAQYDGSGSYIFTFVKNEPPVEGTE